MALMDKYNLFNLLCTDYALNGAEEQAQYELAAKHGLNNCRCHACGADLKPAILRRHKDMDENEAYCLPCFLHNFSDVEQQAIDELVVRLTKANFYL